MPRYDSMTRLTIAEDIEIYDLLSSNIGGFTFNGGFQLHELTEQEALKPYMVSQQYYNTIEYTDLLLEVNGVENPLADLFPGMLISIPALTDIQNYYLNRKQF